MPPWYKRTLSSEDALGRANTHLENARNAKDRRRAQKLCDEAKEALKRIDISKSVKDRDRIVIAYREHGKMLEKWGLGDEAQLSYKKANELSGTTHQSAPAMPSTTDIVPTTNHSPSEAFNSTTPRVNKETVIANIFSKDCLQPVTHCAFPGPDGRLASTRQLSICLALLRAPSSSLGGFDPEALAWLEATQKNQDERDRLGVLAKDLIRALARDELKDKMVIAEVLCLAPVLEKSDFQSLLSMLVNIIKDSLLLNVQSLEGLAHLIQSASPGYIEADDLVKILELLSTRLQETFQQSPQHIYELTITVSRVLDAMADSHIQGLDRVKLHEPLLTYLERLKASKDPYIVYQAAYASQALMCVPDDEEPWQAVLRRSGAIIKGVGGLASAIKGLNIAEFMNGLSTIQEGFQGAGQIFALVQDAYNGVTALKESGEGLLDSLKNGLSFNHKRAWYAALRGVDSLIQNGELINFKTLVCEAPCRRDLAFQWGICQRLGYLALDPARENGSRKDAIALLGEMYWNDEEWGQDPRIKQCILNILLQLSQVLGHGTKGPINIVAEDLLKDLATDGDENKQGLYVACIQSGPSVHSWKVSMPLPDSSSLIDQVQNKPSIEPALRNYQRRRLQEQEQRHAVYIPPQAKATRDSPDDDLFDLTTRVNEFINGGSDAKVLLLLGDSGAGKSTFNLELEKSLWMEYNTNKNWIPVFVTLPAIDTPGDDLIAKQLRRYKFTEDQILELQTYRQIVLICDGYDECQKKDNLYNDNRLNQPGEWNVKMVISCRSEFLGSDYRAFFQPGGRNDRRGAIQLQEAVVAPFSVTKISDYIQSYVALDQSPKDIVWKAEDYENAIKNIPNLQELVRNPFLLSLALEVLPQLVDLSKDVTNNKISRVELYDQFVEQWVERGKIRMIERSLTGDDHAAFEILSEDGFAQNAIGFTKDLAVAIFDKQDGKPVVEYSPIRDKASWKTTFFGQGDGKNLLRESCPLTRNGNQYRFIHRSVLEYALVRAIYDPHTARSGLEVSVEQLSVKEEFDEDYLGMATLPDSPLFRKSLMHEPSIISFLSERVQQSMKFKDQLQQFIERSKTDNRFSQAAANAITILIRAGVQFNGADLRGIRVPGADLSYGYFDSAQLQGADLRNTILENVWLRQADLSDSQMEGVVFGQWPYLQERDLVSCCVFSPDGRRLTVVLVDGSISVYDTSTWSRVDLLCHTDPESRASTSDISDPVGDHFDTISDNPDFMDNQPSEKSFVEFIPRSQQFRFIDNDGTVCFKDERTGALIFTLSGHTGRVNSATRSADGKQIASCSEDTTVRLWDSQSGALSQILTGHTGGVWCVTYSYNSQQIASGSNDNTVRLWDTQTGALSFILSGHIDFVRSVAYSPDGRQIASGSCDETIRLWDARTGTPGHTLSGHKNWVVTLAYSPDGHHVSSGSRDETVRLWDSQTGSLMFTMSDHSNYVASVTYSPNGQQIVSSSHDRTVRLWDVQTGLLISTLSGHTDTVAAVTCSPDGQQIVSGSNDKSVRLWNPQTGSLGFALSGHTNGILSVACSFRDQRIVSGSVDNTVRLWDSKTGAFLLTLNGDVDYASLAFSPSGQQIASGSDDCTVQLWDSKNGSLIRTLSDHSGSVTSVAYSPDGLQIASGSWDKTIRLWDLSTDGTPSRVLSGHTGSVWSVAYSPDGQQIASGSGDGAVRLWDTQTGTLSSTLEGHTSTVRSVVYSPSGQQIASCSQDTTVRLWDVQTGAQSSILSGHSSYVFSVTYSPNGKLIASGSDDRTVRLWGQDSGHCLIVLDDFQDAVTAIAWLNDTSFVVGCDDSSLSTWTVVEEEEEMRLCLRWRSGPNNLVLLNASIQGVQGLSEMNARLFQQHQQMQP